MVQAGKAMGTPPHDAVFSGAEWRAGGGPCNRL